MMSQVFPIPERTTHFHDYCTEFLRLRTTPSQRNHSPLNWERKEILAFALIEYAFFATFHRIARLGKRLLVPKGVVKRFWDDRILQSFCCPEVVALQRNFLPRKKKVFFLSTAILALQRKIFFRKNQRKSTPKS